MTRVFKNKLSNLMNFYDVVVVDTCSIQGYFGNSHPSTLNGLNEKIEASGEFLRSLSYWKSFFEEYGGRKLFVSEGILDELKIGHLNKPYFKIPKRKKNTLRDKKGFLIESSLRQYEGMAKSSWRRTKDLVSTIENRGAILKLNEIERGVHSELYIENEFLREILKIPLSPEDYDFLISGVVISQTRGKTGIISNDCGINLAWRKIVTKYPVLNCKLDFYFREKVDLFKFKSVF